MPNSVAMPPMALTLKQSQHHAVSMQALAVAMVAFLYLYLRRKWGINADSVYRNAMYKLNTNAGVLEVRSLSRATLNPEDLFENL